MKLFWTVALIILSANASADVPPVGSVLTSRLVIGSDQGDKIIPLPAGSWTVAHAGKNKGKMQDTVSNTTPRTYTKVVLVQAEGGQAKMILEVTITTTSNIKLTSTNLCTRKDLIYQNKFSICIS